MSQTVTSPDTRREQRAGRQWRPTSRTVFFGVLLVVLAVYTEIAFGMAWITDGGRIGPGFFPRIVGVLGVAITLAALVNSLRPGVTADEASLEDEVGEGDLGRHPVPLLLTVALSAIFLVTLTSLGAIISSAIFMIGMLWYLNRGRWVMNIVLSIAVPVGMYLLFQTALNAGLPEGILPRI